MKTLKIYFFAITMICLGLNTQAQQWKSKEELKADYELLRTGLETLHGGLYRYRSESDIKGLFAKHEAIFTNSVNQQEAYLSLAAAMAEIVQCGHTYPNYWNQTEEVRTTLFSKADKLPFTLKYIENKWVIEHDLSGNQLPKCTEVVAINGTETSDLIAQLMTVFRGDGNNLNQKINDLNLTGQGKFEAVDIYQPMLVAPVNGSYTISVKQPGKSTEDINVNATDRETRKQLLGSWFGVKATAYDDLWTKRMIDDKTAYLQLGTFVTWKMELDWKAFVEGFFQEVQEKEMENVIIDIRGNGGGTTEVAWYMLKYLTDTKIEVGRYEERMAYAVVPESLKPHLETWESSLFDLSEKLEQGEDSMYYKKRKPKATRTVRPKEVAFTGNTYLLTDEANSSATFLMAKAAKESKLATLVGQSTGGNMKGITGGQMFQLKLPNTGLEVDIPLIGYYAQNDVPDSGLEPDIAVHNKLSDFMAGEDTVLKAVLADIVSKSKE